MLKFIEKNILTLFMRNNKHVNDDDVILYPDTNPNFNLSDIEIPDNAAEDEDLKKLDELYSLISVQEKEIKKSELIYRTIASNIPNMVYALVNKDFIVESADGNNELLTELKEKLDFLDFLDNNIEDKKIYYNIKNSIQLILKREIDSASYELIINNSYFILKLLKIQNNGSTWCLGLFFKLASKKINNFNTSLASNEIERL